jgi:hypothetical protein
VGCIGPGPGRNAHQNRWDRPSLTQGAGDGRELVQFPVPEGLALANASPLPPTATTSFNRC